MTPIRLGQPAGKASASSGSPPWSKRRASPTPPPPARQLPTARLSPARREPSPPGRVPAAVAWGLLAAWAVHDAEELATMAGWTRRARPRLERHLPWAPWERLDQSQRHVNTAIGLMGGVIAGAAAMGARTGGRSATFQAVLAGFGWHGAGHLAQVAVTRGYTPGAVTAPLVVIPYALWAWRRLREAEVPAPAGPATATALVAFPLVLGGVHALAHALTHRRPLDHHASAAVRAPRS